MSPDTSSEFTQSSGLKTLHGRGMNNLSEVYRLPADQEEMDRLSLQHNIWRTVVGGLYPTALEVAIVNLLSVKGGVTPSVLDIGSGSGIWAVEMARRFPQAKIIGYDLSQSKPNNIPVNCSFLAGDVSQGLPQYTGQFDVIHARSVIGHVVDSLSVMKTICSCLKPGGLFIFAEGNFAIFDHNRGRLRPANEEDQGEGSSWMARWFAMCWPLSAAQDEEQFSGENIQRMLENTKFFDKVGGQDYWSPCNWSSDELNAPEELGRMCLQNLLTFIDGVTPNFLSSGLSPDFVIDLKSKVIHELTVPTVRILLKWNIAWGFKYEEEL